MVNRYVEKICIILVALMIIDVWWGVVSRYVLGWNVTWTEELARYIMIWAALMAISIGVYHREHIGLELLFMKLSTPVKKMVLPVLNLISTIFFLLLFYYGITMTIDGLTQYAMIFDMTMVVPYASVPVSCFLAIVQMIRITMLDFKNS